MSKRYLRVLVAAVAALSLGGCSESSEAKKATDGGVASDTVQDNEVSDASSDASSTEGVSGTASVEPTSAVEPTDEASAPVDTGSSTQSDKPTASAVDSGSDSGPLKDADYYAGAAAVDITPSDAEIKGRGIKLGGYGLVVFSERPAEGVHDPVFARSLVLATKSNAIAIVILDVPGIGNRSIKKIRTAAAEAIAGILAAGGSAAPTFAPENVLVGATHSHGAPDLQGFSGFVTNTYEQYAVDGAVEAVVTAFKTRRPAVLRASEGVTPNENRRGWDETDQTVTVLDAVGEDGERIATLVNFAAHPAIAPFDNKLVTRDFCGYTVDKLEAELGGTAIFANGVVGDVLPQEDETVTDPFESARLVGETIADAAMATMGTGTAITGSSIVFKMKSWKQKISNLEMFAGDVLGVFNYDIETEWLVLKAINTQVGYIRLGEELQILAFPGEALTRCGMPIKDAMAAPHKLFLGLTTDSIGYFVPSDEWKTGRNGDYEESVSVDAGVGDTAKAKALELLSLDPQVMW